MRMSRLIKSNRGTSLVFFVIALSVIAACASIAVDIGIVVTRKADIVKATDAAALAGAQALYNGDENPVIVAENYLYKNGVDPDDAEIKLLDDGRGISIITKSEVNYFFAKVLGFDKGEINADAAAKVLPVVSVFKGIRPFAVEHQSFEYGKKYTLKEGGGSGSNGNYGCLALGGTGASNYRFNVLDGFDGELKVGDYVNTETGNMSNPTKSSLDELIRRCDHSPKCTQGSFEPECSRVITVVIVDSLDVNGRKSVQICGFASFFVERVEGQGNKCVVEGYFVKTITQGELSEVQRDYGLRGIKLTK